MADGKTERPDDRDGADARYIALSRWENEGGAAPHASSGRMNLGGTESGIPALTNVELVQLRIRVIALENIVIGLLSQASERQLELAREMAAYICPRPGFTQHPLTVHAAAQMVHLVERAGSFREGTPG